MDEQAFNFHLDIVKRHLLAVNPLNISSVIQLSSVGLGKAIELIELNEAATKAIRDVTVALQTLALRAPHESNPSFVPDRLGIAKDDAVLSIDKLRAAMQTCAPSKRAAILHIQ